MLRVYLSCRCPKCGFNTLFTKFGVSVCVREECGYQAVVQIEGTSEVTTDIDLS